MIRGGKTKIYLYDKDGEKLYNISKEAQSYSYEETETTDDETVLESEAKEYKDIDLVEYDFSIDAIFKNRTVTDLENKFKNATLQLFLNTDNFGKKGILFNNALRTSYAITNSITELIKYSASFKSKEDTQEITSIVKKLSRSVNLPQTDIFTITTNSKLIINVFNLEPDGISPEFIIKFWYDDGSNFVNYDDTTAVTEEGQFVIDIPNPPAGNEIKISVEKQDIGSVNYSIVLL